MSSSRHLVVLEARLLEAYHEWWHIFTYYITR